MIIPSGYAQVTCAFTGGPYPSACTFGVVTSGFSGTPQDIADEVRSDLDSSGVMTQVCDLYRLNEVIIKMGPNATGAVAVNSAYIPGEDTSNASSPQVSFLVRKATASGGRRARGRMFWPGPTEPAVGDDGVIDSGTRTALQGQMDDLFDALVASDLPPVLLHSETGFGAPLDLTGFVVDSRAATQRRRLRR